MAQHDPNQYPVVSLPNSIQERLQRADNLIAQGEQAQASGNYQLAQQYGRQAEAIIAQAAPQIAALIRLAEMGQRGYEIEMVERIDKYQIVERSFLGISLGNEVVNTPTITRRTVRARLL